MKILYITHFFPPELNGGARRVYDLARTWVSMGHEVTVSTGFPSHPTGIVPEEYRGKWLVEETYDGIRTLRAKRYSTPNRGVFLRLFNHFTMAISAFAVNTLRADKYDVVICTSPPLFIGFSGVLLKLFRQLPLVFEIRDLWPQQAIDLGILKGKIIIELSKWLERFFYRWADHLVVVANGSKDVLMSRGIPSEKITLIRNGVLLENFRETTERIEGLDLANKFVVSYIGTFGASQGLMTVLLAAKEIEHRQASSIHFLLVGDGVDRDKLVKFKKDNSLTNVSILGTQPFEKVNVLYRASKVVLVSLKRVPLFSRTIPSKLYEIMAAATPVVGLVDGECKSIIQESGGGFVVEPENHNELANLLIELSGMPTDELKRLGGFGRAWVMRNADRSMLAKQYIDMFTRMT